MLGGGGHGVVGPGEEVELGERARVPGAGVLHVQAPHQIVLAPYVLRHQVHLRLNTHHPSVYAVVRTIL